MAPPSDLDLASLPPEVRAIVEAERAARRALEQKVAALAERNARLEHLIGEFRRALYGRKSEKLSADERQLAFEDLESAVAEAEAAKAGTSGRSRPATFGNARRAGCRGSCRASSASSSRRARSARAAAARWRGSARTGPSGSTSCRRSSR